MMLARSAKLSTLTSPSKSLAARSRPPAFKAPRASFAPALAAAAISITEGPRALGSAARSLKAGTAAPDTRGTTARLTTGPNEATAAGAETAAEAASASASAEALAPAERSWPRAPSSPAVSASSRPVSLTEAAVSGTSSSRARASLATSTAARRIAC